MSGAVVLDLRGTGYGIREIRDHGTERTCQETRDDAHVHRRQRSCPSLSFKIAMGVSVASLTWGFREAFVFARSASSDTVLSPADKPALAVTTEQIDGAVRIDVPLPGALRAYAMPRGADGRRQIALLVEPTTHSSEPRPLRNGPPPEAGAGEASRLWLLSLDTTEPPRLQVMRRDVPSDVRALDAADVDGDGIEDLILWRPGSLDAIRRDPHGDSKETILRLVDDPEIQPEEADARALCDLDCRGDRIVWTSIVGALRGYGPREPSRPRQKTEGKSGDQEESREELARVPGKARDRDGLPANASVPSSPDRPTPQDGASKPDPNRQEWGVVRDLPLPVSTSKQAGVLSMWSPVVRALPAVVFRDSTAEAPGRIHSADAPLIAIGPEPYGPDRLRTLLLDPARSEDDPLEFWSLLPGAEKVIESALMRIDGRPALAVTTRPAEKLSLFKEKWLRVYFLEADRTKRGLPPILALETRINLWQSTEPVALDVDQDGRQDIVLGYWKGLKNHHLVLDAYLRKEDGTFERSSRTTTFEVEDADRSFLDFGRDLDGDGLADLVLLSKNELLVHPGSARSRKGNDLVDGAPRWSLRLRPASVIHVNFPKPENGSDLELGGEDEDVRPDPRVAGTPRFIDLDGDGREEIFVSAAALTGGGRVVVYRFPGRR